jgi:hypothetical protein
MARSKSIPGGKVIRKNNKEQVSGGSPNLSDLKAVPAEIAPVASQPETKAEVSATQESKTVPETKAESHVPKESRKIEVVKNGPRKNVVPINLEDEIRRRAYEIFQQRGSAPGSEAEDWLTAEREVRLRYLQQSA